MILTRLYLKNFSCYGEKEILFQEGVTGIIGENGVGKTSIIDGIEFAFMGSIADVNKDQLATRGSFGDSYVIAEFLLNDIAGSIKRFTGSSKVVLNYDGKEIIKATEVNETWNNLLQIDAHVFKHVIVARQNHIPELFTGDDSVRERAFQKIFMVPNTEKIRSILYNDFLKNAPPRLPEENTATLNAELGELHTKLSGLRISQTQQFNSILSDERYHAFVNTLESYRQILKSIESKPLIESQIDKLTKEFAELTQKLTQYKNTEDIASLVALKDNQIRNKAMWDKKLEILSEKEILSNKISKLTISSDEQYQIALGKEHELSVTVDKLDKATESAQIEIDRLKKENGDFLKLNELPICPTCKQKIPDVHAHVLANNEDIAKLKTLQLTLFNQAHPMSVDLVALNDSIQEYDLAMSRSRAIAEELNRYKNANFDASVLSDIENRIQVYHKNVEEERDINNRLISIEYELRLLRPQLNNGNASFEEVSEQIDLLQQAIDVNKTRNDNLKETDLAIAKIETEIRLLERRVSVATVNGVKNARIDRYNSMMNAVYETLHVSQFPRMLISSFANVIQDKINENIQEFAFPYTVRIDDGFKIVAMDAGGRDLPRVSGGEACVLGICLRLALHSMFSQSFPLMILDEPSTNLSSTKLPMLWNTIENLKNSKKIKQLIIIDHNEGLMNVVDNVIKIAKEVV
jgi:DNA repair protein SbcC/Rad50